MPVLAGVRLQLVHRGRQEVFQQPLEARLAEAAAQMGQLEQVVEIVDRRTDRADVLELFLRGLQMLLNFLELLEALADILIELALHFLADCEQLLVHLLANRLEALARLIGKRLDLQLERATLLFAPAGKMARRSSREVR